MPKLLIFFAWILVLPTFAQSWELYHSYPLTNGLGIAYDTLPDQHLSFTRASKDLTLQELLNGSVRLKQSPITLDLSKGDVIWLHTSLSNGEADPTRFLLQMERSATDWSAIDVFVVDRTSVLEHLRMGNDLAPKDHAIRDLRNLCWVEFTESGEKKDIWVRLESKIDRRRSKLSITSLDRNTFQEFEGMAFQRFADIGIGKYTGTSHLQARFSLEFVLDSLNVFSFEDIKKSWDDHALFFRPEDYYKSRRYTLWCRFKIINNTKTAQHHFFDAGGDPPYTEAFLPGANNTYFKVVTGKKVAAEEKYIAHTLSLVDYTIAPLDTAYLFFKFAPLPPHRPFLVNVHDTGIILVDQTELLTMTGKAGLWKGFMIGIFLFQFLYFILRAILEKTSLGLYYAIMIIGFALLYIWLENQYNTFFAFQIWYYQQDLLLMLAFIALSAGLYLFSNKYLALNKNLPVFFVLQSFLLLLVVLLHIAGFLQSYHYDFEQRMTVFYGVNFSYYALLSFGIFLLSYFVAAVRCLLKKVQYSKNFLLAFSPFLLVTLFNAVQYLEYGEPTGLLYNMMYISFVITSALFANEGVKRYNELKIKEAYAESLVKLDQAKSRFYSNITHEFRTPLTVIMGLANTIKGHTLEKELIRKNGTEMLNLIQQLLDISKAQSGSLQLKLIDENIVYYLEYLIESFYALADQKKIDLRFIAEEEEIIMRFDRDKIKFIFSNLLTNALKFTPKRGKISVQVKKGREHFILSVRDSGIGLSSEEVDRVFDRFYQVKSSGETTQHGDGIGLALVKEIVELFKGDIKVQSTKGKGTTFTVELPLQPPAELQVPTPVPETTSFVSSENEAIALVVEDNPDVLFYIERIIDVKYKVMKAYDGEEGFEIAVNVIPDIIISDVMMPKMDGYALTEKLKEDSRTNHIPIILLTAKATQEEKIKGLAGGADAYLTKPFNEVELNVRMEKLIQVRKKLREAFTKQENISQPSQQPDPFMVQCLEILEYNFADEDFGIKEFGENLHLSRMQVHRKLKALTNLSTSQFINYFRLEKGKVLLEDESLNISEVAYGCGFSDPGYFGKLFAKKYGSSPQIFRKTRKTSKNQ